MIFDHEVIKFICWLVS